MAINYTKFTQSMLSNHHNHLVDEELNPINNNDLFAAQNITIENELNNRQTQLNNLRTRLHNLQNEFNHRPIPLEMFYHINLCAYIGLFFIILSRVGVVSPDTERYTTLSCSMAIIMVLVKMIINNCR